MPMDGIDNDEVPVLRVVFFREEFVEPVDALDEEHVRNHSDRASVRVFRNRNQIFVNLLEYFQVFIQVVVKLVQGPSDCQHLKYLKNEFILYFVFL
jgi:hypothetical protein